MATYCRGARSYDQRLNRKERGLEGGICARRKVVLIEGKNKAHEDLIHDNYPTLVSSHDGFVPALWAMSERGGPET
jgi:hypothetical protein